MRSRRYTTTLGQLTAHSFAIHSDWTISLWLRRLSAGGEYAFYTDNGGSPNIWIGDTAGSVLIRCQSATGPIAYTAASDGEWHQLALVHDATAQTFAAYLDGVEVDATTGVTFVDTTLATYGVLGTITPAGGSADIAFPKIWTAPLTAEEIRSEYLWATPHKQEPALYAYWSFDPSSPATDSSGNGHTLTDVGDGEGGSEPPTLLYPSAAGASGGRARTRSRRH